MANNAAPTILFWFYLLLFSVLARNETDQIFRRQEPALM